MKALIAYVKFGLKSPGDDLEIERIAPNTDS
jgi:hypothetical protein